jgi:dTDP-4-amino-4,6-dideoxygalactose transaminase
MLQAIPIGFIYNLPITDCLEHIDGIRLLDIKNKEDFIHSYFPIFVEKKYYGNSRDEIYDELLKNRIFSKKYFSPLTIDSEKDNVKTSDIQNSIAASNQVLCLPMYGSLCEGDIIRITEIILSKKK